MVKHLVFIFMLLIVTTISTTYCQSVCGTVYTDEMYEQLLQCTSNQLPANKNTALSYIPIQFHVVGHWDGSGYITGSLILKELCFLNEKFKPVNMHFYLYKEFNKINDSYFYTHTPNDQASLDAMEGFNVSNVVNIYIVDIINGGTGGTIAGYYSPARDAVVIRKNFIGQGYTTLTHELGHYFDLPHPFETKWGIENVARSGVNKNCATAGDLFCDTEADFQDYPWSCPYSDSIKDVNGDLYIPDPTLFMSYSDNNCHTRFTAEQINAMGNYLNFFRGYLLNYPLPQTDSLSIPTLLFPNSNATNVEYNVPFYWNSVPGATHYDLQISKSISFTTLNFDICTTDTSFIAGLEEDTKYWWRVMAYTNGNTCNTYTFPQKLTTGFDPGPYVTISPSENNTPLVIFPNPIVNQEVFFIRTTKELNNIQLFNINGEEIYVDYNSSNKFIYSIKLNKLNKGIYFIKTIEQNTLIEKQCKLFVY